MRRSIAALLSVFLPSLAGCVTPSGGPGRADLPVGSSLDHARGSRPEPVVEETGIEASLPPGPVDVNEVVDFAMENHPEVAAARARLEAHLGRRLQSGLFPNPTLSAYMESAPLSGQTTGEAEYPVGIVQPLPLGGRLGAGQRVAEARYRALHLEFLGARRAVERRVRGAFVAALFAREALAIEREIARATGQAASIAAERAAAGDAPPDERARAELEAVRARLSVGEAELLHTRTLLELQAALGGGVAVTEIEGELESALSLPAIESVLERIGDTALLRGHHADIRSSEARVALEEARRVPDLDVGLFYRRVEETSTNAFDVGVSIELPLFDRGQGAIAEARARVVEARARRRAAEIGLASRVRILHETIRRGLGRARLFREELTPRSRLVLDAAGARYQAGEISLAELIPIRRDHRQLELAHLTLLRELALDWSEFRALVAPASDNAIDGSKVSDS